MARRVPENPVVGPRASGFLELFYILLADQGSRCCVTDKDGEAGDIGVYRRCRRTRSNLKTSRSKPDRTLRQAPGIDIVFWGVLMVLAGCAVSPPSEMDHKILGTVPEAFLDVTELRDVPMSGEARRGRQADQIVVKEIRGPSEALGYCVESTVAARSGPFRIRVWVDLSLSVKQVCVMSYPWERGRDVRKLDFTRQFEGKGPEAPLQIGEDIDAMTGATLSSKAMAGGVRDSIALLETIQ